MKKLRVVHADSLNGEITVQGSKNAVLPMMAAVLLTCEPVILHNCPHISDVDNMIKILRSMGVCIRWEQNILFLHAKRIINTDIEECYTKSLRASILIMGALLGREGNVKISYPGGCKIGDRPIDMHLKAFRALGVKISDEDEFITAKGHIMGTGISLRYPSVGATENIILASVCSDVIVRIDGVAREPEIVALCEMLNSMGADISGAGSHSIIIRGVRRLHGTEFFIPGDRIVAGTYAMAALAVGGDIRISGLQASDISSQYIALNKAGAIMDFKNNIWRVKSSGNPKSVRNIRTGPFPEFPTDMQSQFMVALVKSEGISTISEKVYSGRFNIVNELIKAGACIDLENDTAIIKGVDKIYGKNLCATELRGAAGLVIAGLMAEGITYISGIEYLERGYENICRDLNMLGGNLTICM